VSKGYRMLKESLMTKNAGMSWLIKTEEDKFEIWTDQEYTMMKQKCEYYGSKPRWSAVRQLESTTINAYKQPYPTKADGFITDLVFS